MTPTTASVRAAAQEVAKRGLLLPHQLAAFSALDQTLTPEQRKAFTADWRAAGSPAAAPPAPSSPIKPPVVEPQRVGLVGPTQRPDLRAGDHHLVMDDKAETISGFSHTGQRLWTVAALGRGQSTETDWHSRASDTPPGLYKVGTVYRDYEEDPTTSFTTERRAYGWYSFDLIGLEGQEGPGSRDGRDGIMLHGGGSACGWPGAWLPLQPL